MESLVERLASMLASGALRAELDPGRLTAPMQYDLSYNCAVLACAMHELGRKNADGSVSVNHSVLKFAAFIAVRPALLVDFREWRRSQCQGRQLDLQTWPLLPRGYLSDDNQSETLDFLVAVGALHRAGKEVVLDAGSGRLLNHVFEMVTAAELFKSERAVLAELGASRLTQAMLGVGA